MKKVLFTLVILMAFTSVYSQKVKLKKDMILVDKVEKYKLERTKKGNMLTDALPNYVIKDLKGKEIMLFKDSTMHFTQLPNETEKRAYKNVFLFSSPSLNKKAVFPKKASLNYKKYMLNTLTETGFFKADGFTEDHFNSFVEKQELDLLKEWNEYVAKTNEDRVKNYELTKEMFGPLQEREPGLITVRELVISDGSKKIGKFEVKTEGSYATTYNILNKKEKIVGIISIIHKDQVANVKPLVVGEFENFKFEKDSNSQYPTLEVKFGIAAKYLVEQGCL